MSAARSVTKHNRRGFLAGAGAAAGASLLPPRLAFAAVPPVRRSVGAISISVTSIWYRANRNMADRHFQLRRWCRNQILIVGPRVHVFDLPQATLGGWRDSLTGCAKYLEQNRFAMNPSIDGTTPYALPSVSDVSRPLFYLVVNVACWHLAADSLLAVVDKVIE